MFEGNGVLLVNVSMNIFVQPVTKTSNVFFSKNVLYYYYFVIFFVLLD